LANITIPKTLQNQSFEFVLLPKQKKGAYETEWQKKEYKYNTPKLLQHIQQGNNYGCIGGHGQLRIIDIDDTNIIKEVEQQLNTFTVKTGRGGRHFYIKSEYSTNHVFKEKKGEYRAKNYYVVGPNSWHPNGKQYTIHNDVPIQTLTEKELYKILSPYLRPSQSEETQTNKTVHDTSRSGKEFGEVIRQIKEGESKETIFSNMMTSSKWSSAHPAYREKTYEKALRVVDSEYQKKQNINAEDWESTRQYVLELLVDKKRHDATEVMAEEILKRNTIKTIRHDSDNEMWIYNQGIYIPQGKTYIKEYCRKILGQGYTTHLVNTVILKIEADTYIEPKEFFENINPEEIAVQNGILNVVTKQLTPYTPTKVYFNKLPMSYLPGIECPQIINFFQTTLSLKEDVQTIQEIFGYILLREYRFHKAFMFTGNGGNGKSKTLELMKIFLGNNNSINIPIQKLEQDNFILSEFHNKMANLATDIDDSSLKGTGKFKEMTTGDQITAPRKFLSPITFVSYAKMLFSANQIPRTRDSTDAFWRRWVIIDFPYSFVSQKEYDSCCTSDRQTKRVKEDSIIQNISTDEEMVGLLNWSLIGLQRLLQTKDFTKSSTAKDIETLWIRKSNSFQAFIMDHCEVTWDGIVSKNDIRKNYAQYCRNHKIRVMNEKIVKNTLNDLGVGEEKSDVNGKRENVWIGLSLKRIVDSVHPVQGVQGILTLGNFAKNPLGTKNPGHPGHPGREGIIENVIEAKNSQDFLSVITKRQDKVKEGMLPKQGLMDEFGEKNVSEWIRVLLEEGGLYEPRIGFVAVLK